MLRGNIVQTTSLEKLAKTRLALSQIATAKNPGVQALGAGGVGMAGERGAREGDRAPAGRFGALQLQFSSEGWLFSHLILWLQFSHEFFLVEKGPHSECS